MPKLSNKTLAERIRALDIGKNTWIKVNYPGKENGGILDVYRAQEGQFDVYMWDAHRVGNAWFPHNHRVWIYSGVMDGAIALVKKFREGKVT